MKHLKGAAVLAALLMLLSACVNTDGGSSAPPEESASSGVESSQGEASSEPAAAYPTVDLRDTGRLFDVYLRPYYVAGIFSDSWDSYEGIPPHRLAQVYGVMNDTGDWEADDWNVPAEAVEAEVARYMSVPAEYMRTASTYDAAAGVYALSGMGAPLEAKLTEAKQEGDVLTLSFDMLGRADGDGPVGSSVVTLRLAGDGFTYLSCVHVPAESDVSYTGPLDDLMEFMGPEWLAVAGMAIGAAVYLLRRGLKKARA